MSIWQSVIETCDEYSPKTSEPDLNELSQFERKLRSEYERYFLKDVSTGEEDIPFGRYLLHKSDSYHIELHVFSRGYEGEVHCHETWGLFWILSGALSVEEYQLTGVGLTRVSEQYLARGSAASFHPPESGWHKVATTDNDAQTLSVHIYGKGYDLQNGKYSLNTIDIEESARSSFKPNSNFEKRLGVKIHV